MEASKAPQIVPDPTVLLKDIDKTDDWTKMVEEVKTEDDSGFIYVKKGDSFHRINYDDILFIEALSDLVQIKTASARFVHRSTMAAFVEKLPATTFCRTHRSCIVNVNRVDSFNESKAVLEENEVPVSKGYRAELF